MANFQDTKLFTGGLNKDDAPEFLGKDEYLDAHNIRVTGTRESQSGYVTNLESTEPIFRAKPEGVNKTIGCASFPTIRKAYSVEYNTQGKHQLTEFDYETSTEITLFEDLTDTGGETVFNISPEHYFNDIRLLHDRYLIMCDGYSDIVYFIDLEKLKNGGYGTITKNDFNLIKAQSLIPPTFEYINDTSKTSNQLKGKMFQFRSQFEYDDNLRSTWGSYSKLVVPELENTEGYNGDVTKLNAIVVTVDTGSSLVTKLRVGARTGTGGLFIIREKVTSEIKSLPNTTIDIPTEVYEAYDPATNKYSFVFYNDGSYEFVPVVEADLAYDNIPLKVGTVEIVNGNILALGDLLEGYERPVVDVNVSVSTYNANIDTTVTNPRNFTASLANNRIGGSHKRIISIFLSGSPRTSDKFTLSIGDIRPDQPPVTQIVEYTVPSGQNDNLPAVVESIRQIVPHVPDIFGGIGGPAQAIDRGGYWEIRFINNSYIEGKSVSITYNLVGTVYGKDINVLKTGTGYQLALAHFDEFGRQFPIVTNDDFAIKTPSKVSAKNLTPVIGWAINSTPPEGAVSYQWLISENSYFQKTLQVPARYVASESSADYLTLDISALKYYANTSTENNVNYDFTKGDRVTFLYTFSGSSTPIKWYDNPTIDVEVLGFEIKVPDGGGDATYHLKIKNSPIIDTALLSGGVFIELYTPKKSVGGATTDPVSTVFYEIGEQYPIVNGDYSVKTGTITTGDAYYRPRAYRSYADTNVVYGFLVEDFNFSDFYDSRYWSAGRGRVYNDEIGRAERRASIRYSDSYTYGSNVNNINRFYTERLYGESPGQTSSKYGAITKLQMRDNYLVALQELKIGHIPVNLSILEDSIEQAQVAISDKLLNNVRYLPGNIGTGLAKEAITVSKKGNIYFVDVNNGYPCRDGYDGLRIINTKMSKYFMDVMKEVKLNGVKLVGTYDELNDEWNISKVSPDGLIQNIPFNSSSWDNTDSYSASDLEIVSVTNGTASPITAGMVTITPNVDYLGSMPVQFSFQDQFGNTIVKNICIQVIEASQTVDQFYFNSVINANPGTIYTSNEITITGNDVPVEIYALGGEYQINGGSWIFGITSTVNNGDKVKVRATSNGTLGGEQTVTLLVGSTLETTVTGDFKITTRDDIAVNNVGIFATSNGNIGSYDTYTVTLTSDHPLQQAVYIQYYYRYQNEYGIVNSSVFDVVLEEGTTNYSKPYTEIGDVISGGSVELIVLYSEPAENSTVTSEDDIDYVLKIITS